MYKNEECLVNKLLFSSKCGRDKNPCKICFQAVTKRNGLQCQGACKKWAHYVCIGYSPGKIHDIKAGLITIVCPCPDCSATPKEIINKPQRTCPQPECPSNNFPKCEVPDCPKNSCAKTFPSTLPCECVNPTTPVTLSPSNCAKKEKPSPATSKVVIKAKCKEMIAKKSKSCSCSLESSPSGCQSKHKPIMACKKSVSCGPIHAGRPPNLKPVACTSMSFDHCGNSGMELRANDKEKNLQTCNISDALQEMCQTVTELSDQIKKVMCKLAMK